MRQNLTPARKTRIARQLRQTQTPAEKLLWALLRHHQMAGFHFRRQHPVEGYIADFACVRARLIVELDGAVHHQTQDYDQNRDGVLKRHGWTILRFSNDQLERDSKAVWATISAHLR